MRAMAFVSTALILGSGCALVVGIEDHTLATSTSSTTTSAAGGSGGQGTGGDMGTCPAPDLGPTACPAGLADCDGDGTCEATLATDANNCGACHHDCLGGACEASVCKGFAIIPARALSENFGPLALNEGRVYFPAGPHEANTIYSAPITGGTAPKVVSTDPVGEVYHVAVDADVQASFLFATTHDGGQWILHGMLADGGTPNDFETLSDFSTGLVLDGAGVPYVAEKSHILRIAFSTDEVVVSEDPIRGLAADGQYLYWSSHPDAGADMGTIRRATFDGKSPSDLATGLGRPGQIALDGAWVYWSDVERGTISRTLTSGGAVEVLVAGQTMPRALVVLGDDVFWSAADGLYRARLCALGQKPVRLTGNSIASIVADATRVFVTDTSVQQVVSYAR